jgi:hypothetical protein
MQHLTPSQAPFLVIVYSLFFGLRDSVATQSKKVYSLLPALCSLLTLLNRLNC